MKAWTWFNKNLANFGHITIWHETYVVPASHYETIYVNSAPTLLAGGAYRVKTDAGEKYLSTVVDAKRGVLKSSRGRLRLTDGDDHASEKELSDPYQ